MISGDPGIARAVSPDPEEVMEEDDVVIEISESSIWLRPGTVSGNVVFLGLAGNDSALALPRLWVVPVIEVPELLRRSGTVPAYIISAFSLKTRGDNKYAVGNRRLARDR